MSPQLEQLARPPASAPLPLPPFWRFLSLSESVRTVTPQGRELWAAQPATGGGDAGGDAGDVAIRLRQLLADGQPFSVMRGKGDSPPHDVASYDETCVSGGPPLLAALSDHSTKTRAKRQETLLVAFSMLDVAVLSAAGFAATTAGGLAELDLAGFQAMERMPLRFTLVGWNVAAMDRRQPAKLLDVVRQFRAGIRYVPDLHHTAVWQPSDAQVQEIAGAARLRSAASASRAMRASLQTAMPLLTFAEALHRPPATLSDLYRAIEGLKKPGRLGDWDRLQIEQRQIRQIEHLRDTILLKPLLDAADAADDPVQRARLFVLAELIAESIDHCLPRDTRGGAPLPEDEVAAAREQRNRTLRDVVKLCEHANI